LESLEALEEADGEALDCGQNEAVEALEGLKAWRNVPRGRPWRSWKA
jgi:hypothetical protein